MTIRPLEKQNTIITWLKFDILTVVQFCKFHFPYLVFFHFTDALYLIPHQGSKGVRITKSRIEKWELRKWIYWICEELVSVIYGYFREKKCEINVGNLNSTSEICLATWENMVRQGNNWKIGVLIMNISQSFNPCYFNITLHELIKQFITWKLFV